MKNTKEKYYLSDIVEYSKLPKFTVYTRFNSKYRKERWGVEMEKMNDKTYRRFVRKENLKLWRRETNYVGRPLVKKPKGE